MCEGACVPTNVCGVFMRVRRGGCPADCCRGSFVEGGDLLGSERGASPSLPRSTRTPGLIFALRQFPSPSEVARPAPRRSSGARSSVLGGGFRVSGARSWLGRARWRCRSGGRGSEGGSRAGKGVLPFAAGSRSSRVGSIVTCSGPAPPHRPAPSRSLACSPAERRRRRDSGRRLRGRRERGRGECGTGEGAGAARLA